MKVSHGGSSILRLFWSILFGLDFAVWVCGWMDANGCQWMPFRIVDGHWCNVRDSQISPRSNFPRCLTGAKCTGSIRAEIAPHNGLLPQTFRLETFGVKILNLLGTFQVGNSILKFLDWMKVSSSRTKSRSLKCIKIHVLLIFKWNW